MDGDNNVMLVGSLCLSFVFIAYVCRTHARADRLRMQSPVGLVDELVSQRLLLQKQRLLRGAFVYDVNVVDLSSDSMTLNRGELMANNLYIHVNSAIIDTLVLRNRGMRIVSAGVDKNDRNKLVFKVSKGPTVNFANHVGEDTAVRGLKTIMGFFAGPL